MDKLFQNALQCSKCRVILNSTPANDYNVCDCHKAKSEDDFCMINGVRDYSRYNVTDKMIPLFIYEGDNVDVFIDKLLWKIHDKDDKQSLKWIKLISCETDYLHKILQQLENSVLFEQTSRTEVYVEVINEILNRRMKSKDVV